MNNYCTKKTKDSSVKNLIFKDKTAVFWNSRRLSATQRSIVSKIVDEWIERGIVRPSSSEYTSPIVLVAKKDGKPRLCIDYRKLNRKIVRDRYSLPLIEDQLDRLAEATVYCTFDLKDAFFHVPLNKKSIFYTSFVTPDGQYKFLSVPFGLCNSPAVFQWHIRTIFQKLTTKGIILIYLNDLTIPTKDQEKYLLKLEQVLETANMV